MGLLVWGMLSTFHLHKYPEFLTQCITPDPCEKFKSQKNYALHANRCWFGGWLPHAIDFVHAIGTAG